MVDAEPLVRTGGFNLNTDTNEHKRTRDQQAYTAQSEDREYRRRHRLLVEKFITRFVVVIIVLLAVS